MASCSHMSICSVCINAYMCRSMHSTLCTVQLMAIFVFAYIWCTKTTTIYAMNLRMNVIAIAETNKISVVWKYIEKCFHKWQPVHPYHPLHNWTNRNKKRAHNTHVHNQMNVLKFEPCKFHKFSSKDSK